MIHVPVDEAGTPQIRQTGAVAAELGTETKP